MQIRYITIRRFRGIRGLDWNITGKTVCLIGPGDSTKTTILDAIEFALSPRWNISFSDSDFYKGQTHEPFEIVITVGELPIQLMSDEKFGLHLRGWSAGGAVRDEPLDTDEPVLSVKLRVDESLEPTWVVVTDRNPDGCPISSRDREKLGAVRLTSYLDRQLSWSRGSALSRFTGDIEDIGAILAEANRSARDVIQNANLPKLSDAATRAQKAAADYGLKPRENYRPALDAAVSSEGIAALSLHEGSVPVRQAGLGSRRLLALALQQSAVREGAIVLVDEVEQGLEPHRLRHLIRRLRPVTDLAAHADQTVSGAASGQVFMTTHSNIAVVEMAASELHVVRSRDGLTHVTQAPAGLQATIRSSPEALLGEKVIVCEGKTEFGLCRALDALWAMESDVSLAYLGVVPTVGESSGSNAPRIAKDLAALGYGVAYFGDSDKPITPSENELTAVGVRVVLWADNCAIEQRLCLDLPFSALQEFLDLAIQLHEERSVLDAAAAQLKVSSTQLTANLNQWLDLGYTEKDVGVALGNTAKKKGWFKRIGYGGELGKLVVRYLPAMDGKDTSKKIGQLRQWAYGT